MPGRLGFKMRYFFYRNRFLSCGENVIIDVGVIIEGFNLIHIGNNVVIDKNCIISTGLNLQGKIKRKNNDKFAGLCGHVYIDDNSHIAQGCIIMGYGGLHIGHSSVLSSGCKIYTLTNTAYDLEDKSKVISIMPYSQAPFLIAPVVFEPNTWLGINTVVMPSVYVAKNSFSATNSVIMSNFEENSYISGQPATRIRDRFIRKDKT